MTKEINKKLNYLIKIKTLTKELGFKAPKTQKTQNLTKHSSPFHLRAFTMKKYYIYKIILGFQHC
jgi:hypothetical protein